jgi:aerobic carbon-monoxide dehydrogenase small subunit
VHIVEGILDANPVRLTVNGRPVELRVPPDRLLLDALREDLGLTGTKESCSIGVCGACSVIVDGRLVSSCLTLAVQADGAEVTTSEGLAGPDGSLSAVQSAFIRHGGFQCGICTPGQVVAATALLADEPSPDEGEVREFMSGNLCRCTGYYGIVASVLAAASPDPTAEPAIALRPGQHFVEREDHERASVIAGHGHDAGHGAGGHA